MFYSPNVDAFCVVILLKPFVKFIVDVSSVDIPEFGPITKPDVHYVVSFNIDSTNKIT